MSTFKTTVTLRQRFERLCATALCVSAIGLVAYGSIAMCIQPALTA